jgi:DNA segregation ATPase FtsK/SpoIIIE-like protein
MLRPPPTVNLGEETDELFKNAVEVIIQYDRSSASLLQRRLDIGYARAARLIDQLEAAGVVGPAEGSTPRKVLISSVDEILESMNNKKKRSQPEEDLYQATENYKVPTDLKLSKVDIPPWGKQLSEVAGSNDFKDSKDKFPIYLGYDDERKLNVTTLAEMGNLIITGNPQSKKENWLDTVLNTLLLKHSPQELRLILIHTGHYFDLYEGIPHLLSPIITDFDKTRSALKWVQYEADRRKKHFAEAGVRGFDCYNKLPKIAPLARILIVTFSDWVDVETTDSMQLITSTGLNAGIHLFIVANRTSDKNLSPDIKANIPNRAVFTVTSAQDSRLSGVQGAESLEEGEMLYRKGNSEPKTLTTIYTPEINVKEVVEATTQVHHEG